VATAVGGGWIGGGDAQKGGAGVLACMQGGWCSRCRRRPDKLRRWRVMSTANACHESRDGEGEI
jgi:hypothetical protein